MLLLCIAIGLRLSEHLKLTTPFSRHTGTPTGRRKIEQQQQEEEWIRRPANVVRMHIILCLSNMFPMTIPKPPIVWLLWLCEYHKTIAATKEKNKKKTTHTPYEKKTTKTTSEIIMHMHAYKACTAQRYMLPLQSVSVCVLRCCWTSSFAMHFWSLHVYEGEKRADWIAITNSSRRNIIVHIFRIRAVLDFGPVHENVVHGRGRQAEDNVCLCVGTGNEQDTLDRQPDTYTTNQKKNTGPSHTRRKKGLEAAI